MFFLTAGKFKIFGAIFLLVLVLLNSSPTQAEPKDAVIAEIGGETITLKEFREELAKLPPNLRQMAGDSRVQKDFLEQLATSRMLYQEGLKQGLDKVKTVQAQIEEARRKIVLGALLQKEIEARIVAPDEPQISQYYSDHGEEFQQEKQVQARHILVKEEKEALEIAEQLKQGKDFAELAQARSSCSSAANGGDLGFFTRERMVKEFADAAFAMQEGEISPPIKTSFGYHLIKVEKIKEKSTRPLNEVRTAIENKLIQESKNNIFNEYVDTLKKKIKITLHPEILEQH
ncbi:MAG: peptidylprolyl isomerase [Deltaproteobacteria bacterium]|nr:peptidylprolyl isomerase [Deltaproteobacteria bacterium]